MKITKEMLKQLIKEAMAARSFEDMEREFEAGEGVVQRAVVRAPDGEEVELERTAAMSDLDWENAKRVAMGGSAKKPVSYAKRLQKKQDTQAAAYRANQKKPASMYAGSKEPQFEQTVREQEADDEGYSAAHVRRLPMASPQPSLEALMHSAQEGENDFLAGREPQGLYSADKVAQLSHKAYMRGYSDAENSYYGRSGSDPRYLEENAKMKLTKKQLTQIIREELEAVLAEGDPVEMAKARADKQCKKHGEESAECKKWRDRHKDAQRSTRRK